MFTVNESVPAITIPYLVIFLHYDCHFNPLLYLPHPTLVRLFLFAFALLISNYSACADTQSSILETVALENLPFPQQQSLPLFSQGSIARASNFLLPSNLSGQTYSALLSRKQ